MSEPATGAMAHGTPVRLQPGLNQQFVLSTPNALQQMQLSSGTGSVQRFVNLASGVGGRAGNESSANTNCMSGGSFLTLSPTGSRAASHPTLVTSLVSPTRPSQLHGVGNHHIPNHHVVVRKRTRPQDLVLPNDPVKRRILDVKLAKLSQLRSRYADSAAELFFLQAGGCIIDFPSWRQRRATHQLQSFLQSHRLDPLDSAEDLLGTVNSADASNTNATDSGLTVTTEAAGITTSNSVSGVTSRLAASSVDAVANDSVKRANVELSPYKTAPVSARTHSLSNSSSMYDPGSQQLIAERVKQEAYVAQRISQLQREGLWAEKRLPKVQEPPRNKAHWDYLLEEMLWLSADFTQERKWKKANAKKCAKMVQKYFQDKESLQRKEEKSQELKLRRLANFAAKEVKNFWANVNKLVEYKQTTRLEEKRKKALDQHLSFIVDQTEKYSTWLAESMNKTGGQTSANTSRPESPTSAVSDDEFQPNVTSSDDEETIAKEEEREDDEVERLKNESELPLEDLLDLLPKDYFLNRDKDISQIDSMSTKSEDLNVDDVTEDADKEEEKPSPKAKEDKKAVRDSDDDTASESEESGQSESEAESEPSPDDDVSLKTLVDNKQNKDAATGREQADKEIDDATAIAQSLQPKGSTLQTTNVVTSVPFLVRHTLREYQHIGLDWLVTMFDRKLNGILADEMGLGKTIQTIALLAHLACDKGNWGPHLIIVPTSVMLNWEMEFKKWCPAFKILTYYGTIKERKAKRTGWTKQNAFHICITSYKLVIQDHQSFRRKKWQYLVLDEAQNIKNFRSQRWQLLLNFQTSRRLLLTGTPLQNNLMELWSLMHFLMPHVFQSHREFKEWFSNPVTGMLEGNSEYNESIIKRLHKVLRPFLLRRLKTEVEKQLPKKYEHVVMCRLSKRQRYLYDDFMSRAKTKETLATGNLLSVINVLMQLRKVCNHPNLFEVRPVISPFQMDGIVYRTASLVTKALDYDYNKHVDLDFLNLRLADAESMTAVGAYMTRRLGVQKRLIEEMDAMVTAEKPRPPKCALNLWITNSSRRLPVPISSAPLSKNASRLATLPSVEVGQSPCMRLQDHPVKVSGSEVHLIPGAKQARLPVHLVQTATGRHIYFPLQSASSSPTATAVNSVIANGQRVNAVGSINSPAGVATTTSKPADVSTSMSRPDVDTAAVTKTLAVTVRRLSPSLVTRACEPDDVTDDSPLHFTPGLVEERRRARRLARLRSLAAVHERRCERSPVYGADLTWRFRVVDEPPPATPTQTESPAAWRWSGSAACHALASPRLRTHNRLWGVTDALAEAVKTPEQILESLHDILSKFIVYVPAVNAQRLTMHVSHPPPSRLWRERRTEAELETALAPKTRSLHPIVRSMATQFPDPRLIQYDCGKLQVLDRLLRRLKSEHHKVLIFTQMTRMLDVLEAFLNYHGYIYLRLDGTTKVDQRQILMERFNGDDRIFVFILSTRSGGIGVNLTGADTVIFYDSDWNPTMDAQAQDRCHRIGQTRDVHIYRLVSEMTVEENILKKANQKRLLGDLAIEGGNFTTAYFKSQSTIQDLFNVDMTETDASKRMRQTLGGEREKQGTEETTASSEAMGADKVALGALESALETVEDQTDVDAARTATAEAAAELAEFDENIPLEETVDAPEPDISRAEMEVDQLVQQLKPIERYAMRYVEENEAAWSAEQLAAAEAQIEEQKKEWELNRQAAIEAEEARLRDDEEEPDLTYPRVPSNEIWLNQRSIEGLPMWCPPTPPQEEDDVYMDKNLCFLYQDEPLTDSDLPPIYVRKELKRSRTAELPTSIDMRRSLKISRREDSPLSAPRSLFDHPSSAVQKMRRDAKLHKYRGLPRPMPLTTGGTGSLPSSGPIRVAAPLRDENSPDWNIHEDWALLSAVEQLQELPLTLVVVKPAHTPNWDLVSDMVNQVSSTIRSPAQCRNRYEAIIIPREEGKIVQEQKKQKKTKNVYKLPTQKTNRALRTCQLNVQDNNAAFTQAFHQRFDSIKTLVLARKPNPKPLLVNPSLKNPKHFAVLQDSGIAYDTPVNPIDIAQRRADRIAKDKKLQALAQAQAQAAAQPAQASQTSTQADQQQLTVQQRQLVVAAGSVKGGQVTSTSSIPAASVNVAVTLPGGVVGTAQVLSTGTSVATAQAQAVTSTPQTTNIVVASALNTAGVTTLSPAMRQARTVATLPVGLQEMVVAASQSRTVTTSNATATVVSVSNLTQAQLQAARLASGSLVTLPTSTVKAVNTVQMASGAKTLNAAQMTYYRQQAMMRAQPQQRIGVRDSAQVKVVQGQSKVTQVATVQPVSPSQPKAQYIKQTTALTAKGRQEEVAAIVKQQFQRQKVQQAQSTLAAQYLQVQTPQMTALVKTSAPGQSVTIPLPGIAVPQGKAGLSTQLKTTTTTGGTQAMRLNLPANYQQLLNKQARPTKVTQLTKPTNMGVPTQLIVQSAAQGNKAVPTINVQHLHQVIKNAQPQHITVAGGQGVTSGGQVVLAKAGTAGTATLGTRVLPAVSGGRQTIQVVPGAIRSVPQVSVNSSLSSALAGSLKVAGIPGIVRQGNPVRIQTSASGTPIMAVTVQQQQSQSSSDHPQNQS